MVKPLAVNNSEFFLKLSENIRELAKSRPALAALSPREFNTIVNAWRIGEYFVDELDRLVQLATIDYQAQRVAFLARVGRSDSEHTRRCYSAALDRLESFAARRKIDVATLRAHDAEDWIADMKAEKRASGSVRRDIAVASSLFTFLERETGGRVRSPFRGTKARPPKRAAKAAAFPSHEEACCILDALAPGLRAAAAVMVNRGLRVGALPGLTIRKGQFSAQSRGADISGELPSEVLEAIRIAGLNLRSPFAEMTATKIADGIRKKTGQLAKDGTIAAPYSAHDLRHLFAATEYRKDRDLCRVSRLLGHASIHVTETYLRGLGEVY
jgi:site-specific recombinase XerD